MARKDAWPSHGSPPSSFQRLVAPAAFVLAFAVTAFGLRLDGSLCAQTTRRAPANKQATAAPRAANPQVILADSEGRAQTMAVVNGEPISRDALAKECLRRFGRELIEGEINKYLIREECKKHNVQITEQEIDAEVAKTAAGLRLTPERLYAVMEDERQIGRDQYRLDIVWPMLALRRLAADQLQVTKAEMQKAIETEFGPKVQVRMISVSSAEKAAKLHALATQNPDDFDRLAKDHSEDPNTAAARGLVPPIRKHVGHAEIENAVFAMQPGDISQVIEVANQYLILKCERHIPAVKVPADQQKAIAAQLEERIRDTKLRAVASELFKKLQDEAKVVNVMDDPELRKQMPGVAATINGGQILLKDLAEQCLVRHGQDVLDGEINRKLLQQALRRRSLQITREDLEAEIERAADSFGFVDAQGKVDQRAWLEHVSKEGNIRVELYVDDVVWPSVALKKLVTTKIEVTDEDLQKGFAANYGERVEVLAIVMNDQRTAHEVFQQARENPTDQWFGELAHQYSVEPVSRANYGQVPPIRRFGGQPLLEEEAFRLKPGEMSGVLAVGNTFVLLRCLGFTDPVVEDLEVVREELSRDIMEKKTRIAMTREFDALKETAQIDNFLAKTSQVPRQPGAVRPASHASPAAAPARAAATPGATAPVRRNNADGNTNGAAAKRTAGPSRPSGPVRSVTPR